MTRTLAETADAMQSAATTVAHARTVLAAAELDRSAFGGDAAGQLGVVGVRLQLLWSGALDARAGEAADLAGRLDEAAHTLLLTAGRYADAEQTAQQSWPEETP